MMFISSIPPLNGNNYNTWREKLEIALALSDNDLALISLCPTKLVIPVREANETNAAFAMWQNHSKWHAFEGARLPLDTKHPES